MCVYSPVKGKDAPKAMVQTLGTSQVQHPGNPLRPVHETRADGVRPEVGTALAGVRHAKGVRHLQTGGADPQGGPGGDEQVRNPQRLVFIFPGMRKDCLCKSACLWNSLQRSGRRSCTRITSAPSVYVCKMEPVWKPVCSFCRVSLLYSWNSRCHWSPWWCLAVCRSKCFL